MILYFNFKTCAISILKTFVQNNSGIFTYTQPMCIDSFGEESLIVLDIS